MKNNLDVKKNKIPLIYHFVFWALYFSFNVIRWGSYFDDYWYSLKSNLVEFPLHIIIVYFNVYFLIPKFIITRKYKTYIFLLLASLCILYILRTSLNYLLVTKNIWPEAETSQQAFTFNHITAVILGEIYVISFVTLIKLIVDWVYLKKRIEMLQETQLTSELEFLKAQIQPHFFFNTLNNLYALTLEKSDNAPNVVIKLSEIMEYVLYGVKEPKIKLLKEIKYIQNYIDLEKLRHGNKVHVKMNLVGDIEHSIVPPLLFLPFIENCFKHGAKDNKYLSILISFEKKSNHTLVFSVTNNFNQYSNNTAHGIGNKNVVRRLDLLYKNNYTLEVQIIKQKYTVTLTIPT